MESNQVIITAPQIFELAHGSIVTTPQHDGRPMAGVVIENPGRSDDSRSHVEWSNGLWWALDAGQVYEIGQAMYLGTPVVQLHGDIRVVEQA